ncbi:MAG: hypothetical protein J0H34_18690 [Rhizobiales bacterium]|nr:hypothetical protein [Hyphomicrobiales bacterium]
MRYHLSRRVHLLRIMALGLDVGVAVAAFLLAYMTAHGTYGVAMVPGILDKSIGFAAISLTFLIIFSVHRGSWRYVSIPDLVAIIKAGAASVLVYTMVAFVLTRGSNVPRSVPILCFLYMVAGMSSLRLLYRLYRERTVAAPSPVYPLRPGRRNILLYGLNDNAESFIRAIRRGGKSMFNVVGILDDNIFNQVRTVQGVRVLGNFASLRQAVEGLERSGRKVSELVITEGSPSRERLIEVVELAASIGLKASPTSGTSPR